MGHGIYDESWDRPHAPGPGDSWQESDWLAFYDSKAGVGTIYRVGQEPNRRSGQPGLFTFALGGQRFFMKDLGGRGLDNALRPEDRWATGYRVGGHTVESLGGERMRFAWDYPETAAELEFSDSHYTPRNWSDTGKGAELMRTLNPDGHLECAGRVRGTVRIGASVYEIDCFGHRDRSWGLRTAYVGRAKKILTTWGTTGRAYSHAVLRFEQKDGPTVVTGFVMRNGQITEASDLRLMTTMDIDYVSAIEGRAVITLESGEVITQHCKLAQCHAGRGPGTAFSGVGTFEHEGKTGFCVYSSLVNPSRGDHISTPEELTLAVAQAGLSETRPHPSFG